MPAEGSIRARETGEGGGPRAREPVEWTPRAESRPGVAPSAGPTPRTGPGPRRDLPPARNLVSLPPRSPPVGRRRGPGRHRPERPRPSPLLRRLAAEGHPEVPADRPRAPEALPGAGGRHPLAPAPRAQDGGPGRPGGNLLAARAARRGRGPLPGQPGRPGRGPAQGRFPRPRSRHPPPPRRLPRRPGPDGRGRRGAPSGRSLRRAGPRRPPPAPHPGHAPGAGASIRRGPRGVRAGPGPDPRVEPPGPGRVHGPPAPRLLQRRSASRLPPPGRGRDRHRRRGAAPPGCLPDGGRGPRESWPARRVGRPLPSGLRRGRRRR